MRSFVRCATDFSFYGQMLRFAQHDKERPGLVDRQA